MRTLLYLKKRDHDVFYESLIRRHSDLIDKSLQNKIRYTKIGLAGLGSIGSRIAETIVRLGAEYLIIADPDIIELSNLNRQNYNLKQLRKPKALCIKEILRNINPYINIDAHTEGINLNNVTKIFKKTEVVFDTMDKYLPKVILHRAMRSLGVPIIHATYFGYTVAVTTFMPNGISYEEMLQLPSRGRDIHAISETELTEHRRKIMREFGLRIYSEQIINKNQPSVAFILSSIIASQFAVAELIKYLNGDKDNLTIAPQILEVDVLTNQIKKREYENDDPSFACLFSYYT